MIIDEIKQKLAKKATAFKTGGFKPTYAVTESWIGKVYLCKEGEELPVDEKGNPMIPLFQMCLEGLPYIPSILDGTKVITVFISENLPVDIHGDVIPNGQNWELREYKTTDELIVKDLENPASRLKPFPLKPSFLEEDYPVWDGGGIPEDLEDKILELENSGEIEDYYDIAENMYEHKLGGYPSFCQPGINFGEDTEFVFQIISDDKAKLNIVDTGTIYLAKNRNTGEWVYYCDFY